MRTRNVDKQELVRQKTIEMIVTDGLEGFSVNKLAKACDISVATIYIYYKDKDDLITQVGIEEGRRMSEATLKGFDENAGFEEGLRIQWRNRAKFMMTNNTAQLFFEQLRNSSYQEKIFKSIQQYFIDTLGKFMKNCIARKEINPLPIEVYWSVAFAPLYNLIRFHQEGRSLGGKKFRLSDKLIWQTFDLVVKGLKP
ncbi:MAG: TetR/AcrR family transcriptional regulator [Sphingobacteriales bacterium]|nr:MAG: TetR/AcrR family transcriptional regulator [Sphingobacteriales bacterium]